MPPSARALPRATSAAARRRRAAPCRATSARAAPRAARRDARIAGGDTHRRGDGVGQLQQRVRLIGADVERLVPRRRRVDRVRHHRRHVVDIAERARLRPVAEDRHRLALQNLVHEDADDVAIAIADVLPRTEHVVRAEDDVVEAEQLAARAQLHLHRVFRDAVRILWRRHVLFGHGRRRPAVNRNRRREHERLHAAVDRRVQQVDAADDVVGVVEPLDEVTQPLGSVRREVIDVVEAAAR